MDTKETEKAAVRESLLILVLIEPPTRGGADAASVVVDNRNELRQFLVSWRLRITPEQVSLPASGGNRRVAELRREEVALLVGVSVDYYAGLERGIGTESPRACWRRWPKRCSSTARRGRASVPVR
jgi:hypothetical protein